MNRARSKKGATMKIGALEELAGVSRDTIHFYIRSGLLHRPVKTGATIAYYDDTHLERLRRIRALRAHDVPLPVIRRVLEQGGERLSAADLELIGQVLSCAERADPPRAPTLPAPALALAERLGLKAQAESDGRLGAAVGALAELPAATQGLGCAMAEVLVAQAREAVAREQAPLLAWLGAQEDPAAAVQELRRVQEALRALAHAARDALVRDALAAGVHSLLEGAGAGRRAAAPRRTSG